MNKLQLTEYYRYKIGRSSFPPGASHTKRPRPNASKKPSLKWRDRFVKLFALLDGRLYTRQTLLQETKAPTQNNHRSHSPSNVMAPLPFFLRDLSQKCIHPVGIPLPIELDQALTSLSVNDLLNGPRSVSIRGNKISEANLSEKLKHVLVHLLTIGAQQLQLTPKDFNINIAIDDHGTGNSISQARYDVHWDFFKDVFEMHHRGEPVPDFKRFFDYSGQPFKPTEYLGLTLNDLAAIGLHPKHFNTFSEFKSAVNNIPDTKFKSCPHGFQCLSSLNLHRAPQRKPDQLFIGIQQIAEKNFYTNRDG